MDVQIIKKIIEHFLLEREEIISAYLYGSSLYSSDYKDIDIGLLIDKDFDSPLFYEEKLEKIIEKELKEETQILKSIHIQILNRKSLRFLFFILKNSILVFCSKESDRILFESIIMKKYIDFKPHIDLYDELRQLKYASQ